MRPEALNDKGKNLFPALHKFSDFYLAGGTALALQIGHRVSVDFDLFSGKAIPKNFLEKVKNIFPQKPIAPLVNNADELTLLVGGLKITFLRYPFSPLFDLIDYKGVKLLGVKEIAATKAYSIGRRGSFKDYIDLYFVILENYSSLEEIIRTAEKKYKNEFNSRLFLEQLVYLEDIEDTEIIFLKHKAGKEELERFFSKKIKELELK
jgi:hypothetical protein